MASEVMTESLIAGPRVCLWTAIVTSVLVLILVSGSERWLVDVGWHWFMGVRPA